MYSELQEEFKNYKGKPMVNVNGTILVGYFEDVLKESDELAKSVINLFEQFSSTTDEEMIIIRGRYKTLFEESRWSFFEASLIDE